ncbi:MAG: hypothetical protein M1830_010822 [Pleopsidium flavum]|nr:MAG: hypothetical protein M1830_010822 [Pleopsidium flavum]
MTSSPPPEAPHFRGKTLTPESPRPVHLPEPSNILLLQNQIDPVFNQMSTYMESTTSTQNAATTNQSVQNDYNQDKPLSPSTFTAVENGLGSGTTFGNAVGTAGDGYDDYAMSLEFDDGEDDQKSPATVQNQLSSNHATVVSPMATSENFTAPTQTEHTHEPHGPFDLPSENILPVLTNSYTTLQNAPTSPFVLNSTADAARAAPDVSSFESGFQSQTSAGFAADVSNGGVNYQTLLDNLSPSTATAPTADGITAATTASPSANSNVPRPSSANSPIAGLPTPAGLPPRPPPQEKPAIHPNYTPGDDIRSYHQLHTQTPTVPPTFASPASSSFRPSHGLPPPLIAAGAPGTASISSGLPPPPLATFQQPPPPGVSQPQQSPSAQTFRHRESMGRNIARSAVSADGDEDQEPWGPDIQKKYDDFLRDERVYVTEGLWDRFPPGSRLFIGNLPTEKVTKRDLFHIFHRHGKLAQVSIKQAYGFVQFLDAAACSRALQAEQGMSVRGRRMHLEISKPQKNTRNAAATAAGDNLRLGLSRRSRSPEYGRGALSPRNPGQRMSGDRFDRAYDSRGGRSLPFSDFRDEPRRRDDYRPMRSPSPRGYRGRDEYRGGRDRSRDRYESGRKSRSRSPIGRNGRYRSRSPRGRDRDEDTTFSLPKRDPRDVPEVQIILMDEVDRTFISYVEKSFRDRSIRCDVLVLSPRLSLAAVVRRQILEGVQAVVKLTRQAQFSGKIPLQVFNRSAGVDNVQFDEYDDLDTHIAAELVVRAKQTHGAPPTAQYGAPPQAYGMPQYAQPFGQTIPQQSQQQPPAAATPNLASLITSLDGPTLQKLLGAMGQSPQTPQQPVPQLQQPAPTGFSADLASLLNGTARQPPQQQPYQQQQQAPVQGANPYAALASNSAFANTPGLATLLGGTAGRPQQPMLQQQQQPQSAQQVHTIMEQLAKWRQ